ncbi:hypothetical protein J3R82DRAFT_7091 [Butyriboletus roseoflavus]|nr:hypothetical protein J3R82DRAFT_7091 [Butyriboletus roseoflavus]
MDPTPPVSSSKLFDLSGQNVLITGATRGNVLRAPSHWLKRVLLFVLFRENPLWAVNRTRPPADSIRALGGSAHIVHCDLANLDAVRELFPKALEVMGGNIHVLVNCAGIQRRSPSVSFSERDWDDVLNVNLKSAWLLSQAAGRHMVPLRRGKIINFCSVMTFQGGLTIPAYASAKGALGQLTKALSNEWSQHNVQVNGICPGYITTDM